MADRVYGNFQIRGIAEVSALVAGQGAVAEYIGPGDVAGRGKRRDEAADGKVPLMEGLPVELKAMGVLVGHAFLQGFHVAVGNSVQTDDQALGERGHAR